MKWSCLFFLGWVGAATLARGDAAGDLFAKGTAADNAGDYTAAVAAYEEILTNYPNASMADEARLRVGIDYTHLGDNLKSIDRLSKLTAPTVKPESRGPALFYTGLAQLAQAGKVDGDARKAPLNQATTTFNSLITLLTGAPSADNRDLLEDALYYRAFVGFQKQDYPATEKDLLQLLQQFGTSLRRPDYLLLLGNLYASQASQQLAGRKPNDPADAVRASAGKALDAFDKVSNDPNALVQANEANMRKAEVLYLVAQLDLPSTDGYAKALAAFRQVKRKADLLQVQTQRLQDLKLQAQAKVASGGTSGTFSRLIEREQSRLNELQRGTDPIVQALIRIGECYNAMRQGDEARTVLHRLAHPEAKLNPAQQQEVDYQIIYSYALGGQSAKADAALTDYLAKHPGDKQAESISYQLAENLIEQKNFEGALLQANRSLKDFPTGGFAAAAYSAKAEALRNLGRLQEAQDALAAASKLPGQGNLAVANTLQLGQTKAAQGDLSGALAEYQKVRDNAQAGELQAAGAALYLQTLFNMQKYDEALAESKAFATKFPSSKSLSGALLIGALALDKKNDPGAVAALQDVAKNAPKDDSSGVFALGTVVTIYQRTNKIPEMIQAAQALATAYPDAYAQRLQAADAVAQTLLKQKKYNDAIAQYQPLVSADKSDVAATARNKIGALQLALAKSMGSYQSLQTEADRAEAQKRLAASEQTYVGVLKNYPDQLEAVGNAFQGLTEDTVQRRSWGLLKDAELETALGTATATLTSPEMLARVEMAKAGLVFVMKDGRKQYAAMTERFKKAVDANPALALTRQEANQFGELLIAAKDYDRAIALYTNLLKGAPANDVMTIADADYGLGATYLAQGKLEEARKHFLDLKALSGGAAWHPHIQEANFGIALAQEKSATPTDLAAAKQAYGDIMRSSSVPPLVAAQATVGYGRLLEKAGHGLKAPGQQDIEYALYYYQQANTFYGPATPAVSAEALYLSGQLYAKSGDKVNARAQYQQIVTAYAKTAPDWAEKAQAALTQLGA